MEVDNVGGLRGSRKSSEREDKREEFHESECSKGSCFNAEPASYKSAGLYVIRIT
jgi:hypothetical protein